MHTTRSFLCLSIALTLIAGCGGDASTPTTPSTITNLATPTMIAALEVPLPPNPTAATGTTTMVYNAATGLFNISVTVNGVALAVVTGFHIHLGDPGFMGGIIVDLTGMGLTFMDMGGGVLTAEANGVPFPSANVAALLAGGCYVNLHTVMNPTGEIRGQLVVQP